MYRGILFKNGVKVERVVTGRMVLVHLNRFNLPIIHCTSILLQIVELYRALSCSHAGSGSFAVRRFEADGWSLVEIPGSGCLGNQLMHLLPGHVLIIGLL